MGKRRRLLLQASPGVTEGIRANYAHVSEAPGELTIDVAQVNPSRDFGTLVGRIRLSSSAAQQLHTSLGEALERYITKAVEQEFGSDITVHDMPNDTADGAIDGPADGALDSSEEVGEEDSDDPER